LKILFLSHRFYPDIGGIEVNSEILATAFHNAGHDVRLLTWTDKTGTKSFPFTVIRKPAYKVLFKQHNWADVVYENNPCLRLAWPNIFFNKPSCIALRTWVSRINGEIGLQDQLKKWWLKKAAAVIAVSDAVRRKSWPAATVIGNPYRINLFRVIDGIPRNKKFVFLGRLVSDKGASMAIEALHKLKNLQPETFTSKSTLLTIIGDGEQRDYLQELVIKLGVHENVVFTGSLSGDPLVHCLNEHQYLIVPSLWEEPFGNVALEGMACGCIPIVSSGGGLPDATGNAGIVFKRGSVDDLVATILSVVENPTLKQQLQNAAAAHLSEHDPFTVANRYLEIIENVLVKS